MLCVCVDDMINVVFSVYIVRRGAVGSHLVEPLCYGVVYGV